MFRVAVLPEAETIAVVGSQVRPTIAAEGQARETAPVNPPEGATVTEVVVLVPGLAIVAAPAVNVKAGVAAELTVRSMVVEAVMSPVAASAAVTATE